MITLRAGSATDTGLVRRNNQDQLLIQERVFAVADGMGGHVGGEVASLTAVEALRAAFAQDPDATRTSDDLRNAVRWANRAVFLRSQEEGDTLRGMGTTLTAVAAVEEDGEERLAVANVGDSRAYVFVKGELTQLTEDHSVPEELVRQGHLEPEEVATHPQRHILTRVLGITADIEVDLWEVLPFTGDRLLLCSDGLCRELSDDQIASVLRRLADPGEAAKELVSRARASGGADNITVVVVDVVDDGGRARAASAALGKDAALAPAPPARQATPQPEATPEPPPEPPEPQAAPEPQTAHVPSPDRPRQRRITLRVIAFLLLLGLVFAAAAAAVRYYARDSFYVGLGAGQPQTLTIYRGRPGGVLWLKPTVAERSGVTSNQVLPARLADLTHGKIWPTIAEARAYVERLRQEAVAVRTPTPSGSGSPSTLPSLPPLPFGTTIP